MATPAKPPRIDLAALKSRNASGGTRSQDSQDSASSTTVTPHSAISYRSSGPTSSGSGLSSSSHSKTPKALSSSHQNIKQSQHSQESHSRTGSGSTKRWSPSSLPISSEEASHVLSVMIRAKEFDAAEAQATAPQVLEGQLSKYTNVMKGWQYRWFILDPHQGTLEYYMPDDRRRKQPRGRIDLSGAIVCPSEEDGTLLSVSAATGECYKLKTSDGKERQFWVDKLRQAALLAAEGGASERRPVKTKGNTRKSRRVSPDPSGESATLAAVRDILIQTQTFERQLAAGIESYTATDPDLLILKATSTATTSSLEDCFAILQAIEQQVSGSGKK